jgi:hypothetical protein
MFTIGLEPGNVYTAWWVLANNPEFCEADPCSGGDFIGKAVEAETVVTYADGVIVDESGEAHFASFLPAGEVTDDPWFPGTEFANPSGAEIHLVINSHGPLIPEMAGEMVNSYRAGCTDDSLPPPFPDTAKADGEAGPNDCALVQAAVFQPADATDEAGGVHAEGMVVTHPSTGAMEPIEGATAHIVRSDDGVLAEMHAIGLEPGNVYTAWWVLANDPEVCEADPCSGGDFIGKAVEAETVVTYADGVIVGESGEAHFASFLPAGEVTDDPWFPGTAFANPSGAEIHLVINSHGPLIPEMAGEMLNSYRAGCTDDSLPPPFPDTAKADGEAGPNDCALVQAAVYQPGME